MKNKKINAETIMDSKSKEILITAASPDEVKNYLKEIDIKEVLPERQKKIYTYVKFALLKSLGPKSSSDVVFAALIERIARSAAYLDQIEELLLTGRLPPEVGANQIKKPDHGSPYVQIQQEHRKCVETFANLRYAEEKKKGAKVLEVLRREVWGDDNG